MVWKQSRARTTALGPKSIVIHFTAPWAWWLFATQLNRKDQTKSLFKIEKPEITSADPHKSNIDTDKITSEVSASASKVRQRDFRREKHPFVSHQQDIKQDRQEVSSVTDKVLINFR